MPLLRENAKTIAKHFFPSNVHDVTEGVGLRSTLQRAASFSTLLGSPRRSKVSSSRNEPTKVPETKMEKSLQYGFQIFTLLAFDESYKSINVDDLITTLTYVTGDQNQNHCAILLAQVLSPAHYNLIIEKLIHCEAKEINQAKQPFMRENSIASKMLKVQIKHLDQTWFDRLAEQYLKPLVSMVKQELNSQKEAFAAKQKESVTEQGASKSTNSSAPKFTLEWTPAFCDQLADIAKKFFTDVLTPEHINEIPAAIKNICNTVYQQLDQHLLKPDTDIQPNYTKYLEKCNKRTDGILIKISVIFFFRYLNLFITNFQDPELNHKLTRDDQEAIRSVLMKGLAIPLQNFVNRLDASKSNVKSMSGNSDLKDWNNRLEEMFSQNIASANSSGATHNDNTQHMGTSLLDQLREFLLEIVRHRFDLAYDMPVTGTLDLLTKLSGEALPKDIEPYVAEQTTAVQSDVVNERMVLPDELKKLIELENYDSLRAKLSTEPRIKLTDPVNPDFMEFAWQHLNQTRKKIVAHLKTPTKPMIKNTMTEQSDSENTKSTNSLGSTNTIDHTRILKLIDLVIEDRKVDEAQFSLQELKALRRSVRHFFEMTNQNDADALTIEEHEELENELKEPKNILYLLAAHFVKLDPRYNPLTKSAIENKQSYGRALKRLMMCCLRLRDILFKEKWGDSDKENWSTINKKKNAVFTEAYMQHKEFVVWMLKTEIAKKDNTDTTAATTAIELANIGFGEKDIAKAFLLFIDNITPIKLARYESLTELDPNPLKSTLPGATIHTQPLPKPSTTNNCRLKEKGKEKVTCTFTMGTFGSINSSIDDSHQEKPGLAPKVNIEKPDDHDRPTRKPSPFSSRSGS